MMTFNKKGCLIKEDEELHYGNFMIQHYPNNAWCFNGNWTFSKDFSHNSRQAYWCPSQVVITNIKHIPYLRVHQKQSCWPAGRTKSPKWTRNIIFLIIKTTEKDLDVYILPFFFFLGHLKVITLKPCTSHDSKQGFCSIYKIKFKIYIHFNYHIAYNLTPWYQ